MDSAVRPAPDGARVAVIGKDYLREPSWADNHLFVSDGSAMQRVGSGLDRRVANVTTGDLVVRGSGISCEWLDDRVLVAQIGDEGRTLPYRCEVDSSEASPVVSGEIVCNAIAVAGDRVVIVASDRSRPIQVHAIDDGAMRQVSRNDSDCLEPYRRDPVRHRLTHPEGHDLDSWLIERRDAAKPGPAVIQIRGNPHAAHGPTPWLEMLAPADAGFHVLYPNPRSSSGYGDPFTRAIHGRRGRSTDRIISVSSSGQSRPRLPTPAGSA